MYIFEWITTFESKRVREKEEEEATRIKSQTNQNDSNKPLNILLVWTNNHTKIYRQCAKRFEEKTTWKILHFSRARIILLFFHRIFYVSIASLDGIFVVVGHRLILFFVIPFCHSRIFFSCILWSLFDCCSN